MDAERALWRFVVSDEDSGTRLDRYLARANPDLSRSYIQHLISDHHVEVNGRTVKASHLVQTGDQISLVVPVPKPSDIAPEDIPLNVVFEDDDVLVVDKPAGMVVHPAPGHSGGTLVNALIFRYPNLRIGDDLRPGIVHRIDRDTSGLLVVAKHDRAKALLQEQQQARRMLKVYQALIEGHFREPQGVIDAPIERNPNDRLRMAIIPTGRPSRTYYRTCERLGPYTLIEAKLETGRTHQIRVHFAHKHHPIVGDQLYGSRRSMNALGLKRQFLHATRLGFRRMNGDWIELTSPLPAELQTVLDALRAQYGEALQPFDPETPWWEQLAAPAGDESETGSTVET
jgi:23S rRNA pseudouridine1911/1915/1917 synthase